jgi:hypothetical protein
MKKALLIIGMICAICTATNVAIAKSVSLTTNVVMVKIDVSSTAKPIATAPEDSFGTYEKPINIGSGSPSPKPPVKSHLTIVDYKTVAMTSLDPGGDPLEPLPGF